jgi:hypothetical protein
MGTAAFLAPHCEAQRVRHISGMSRIAIASLAGVAGFCAYIWLAVVLADHVIPLHWAVELIYFVAAGILWVWPAKWLMIWGAGGARRAG